MTNKTIDAESNTISNIDLDDFKASVVVLESEGISSNDSDTKIATAAATKDYADTIDTKLKNVHGWGYYSDSLGSTPTQVFNTTPAKLSIDASGSTTDEEYLPLEIRGSSSLWSDASNKITPIGVGDSYELRIDMTVISETGSPSDIIIQLDIGGGSSPSTVIVTKYQSTGKGTPYAISASFPIFCLATFIANGGQIFISTDTGSVTVSDRAILISRMSSGSVS